jgi:hypothetical protein
MRAAPTPLTEQAIAAPADALCEIILSLVRGIFAFCLFVLVLRV